MIVDFQMSSINVITQKGKDQLNKPLLGSNVACFDLSKKLGITTYYMAIKTDIHAYVTGLF